MNLLLVDDDEIKRYATAVRLRRSGIDVVQTSTFEEAVDLSYKQQFNVAILDVVLRGNTGYDLCRIIKERQPIPVMLYSAYPISKEQFQASGADKYIEYAANLDNLCAEIQAFTQP